MYTEKQRNTIIQKYTSEMSIIKLRGNIILNPVSVFGYLEPEVEVRALQLRKIVEQIILCSLITNSDKYLEYYDKLGKVWNVNLICKDLKNLNPGYLPVAATNNYSEHTISDNNESTLSESELLSIHEKMGKLLHAKNPFSSAIDYNSLLEYIKNSYLKIVKYLNAHTIKLYGGDDFLFVVMQAENHNGQVAANWFSRAQETDVPIHDSAT